MSEHQSTTNQRPKRKCTQMKYTEYNNIHNDIDNNNNDNTIDNINNSSYILPSSNPTYIPYNDRLSIWEDKGKCGDNELYDNNNVLNDKCIELARLIQQSKHCIILTGAGISTSCGIADFRSPNGVWTKQLKKQKLIKKQLKQQQQQKDKYNKRIKYNNNVDNNAINDNDEIIDLTSIEHTDNNNITINNLSSVIPSLSHMSISTLVQYNHIQYVISQNIDCLHLRSGIPRTKLVEIHGNLYAEQCYNYKTCGIEYIRSYDINGIGCRLTGRLCDNQLCKQSLYDKTYDWTTDLASEELRRTEQQFNICDLCIIIGTSLRVDPIARFPLKCIKRNIPVVLINLQTTYIDNQCTLRIFGDCDTVMEKVMKYMKLNIQLYHPYIILQPYYPKTNKYVYLKHKTLIEPDKPAYIKQ